MASKGARLDRPECPRAWVMEGFKTSYCAPLSFGPVNQNLSRSPCRLDSNMTYRLVDCRHPRALRTSALGDTFPRVKCNTTPTDRGTAVH